MSLFVYLHILPRGRFLLLVLGLVLVLEAGLRVYSGVCTVGDN